MWLRPGCILYVTGYVPTVYVTAYVTMYVAGYVTCTNPGLCQEVVRASGQPNKVPLVVTFKDVPILNPDNTAIGTVMYS